MTADLAGEMIQAAVVLAEEVMINKKAAGFFSQPFYFLKSRRFIIAFYAKMD
jgi:hypothetical protein